MAKRDDAQLSRRERQIMEIVYRKGSATAGEVMEGMADPPSYSAVRALLRVLEGKGHLRHRQDGPRYVYMPAMAPDAARTAAIRHVINTFFGGSAEEAAVALLQMSDTRLPADALERLTRAVHKARKEGR